MCLGNSRNTGIIEKLKVSLDLPFKEEGRCQYLRGGAGRGGHDCIEERGDVNLKWKIRKCRENKRK